jgi:hypothetical protein
VNQFYIDGCGTLQTVALRWPIFKQKKGSATISLGLNYCSMGLSHSLSCDTVPLNLFPFVVFAYLSNSLLSFSLKLYGFVFIIPCSFVFFTKTNKTEVLLTNLSSNVYGSVNLICEFFR